MDFKAFSEDNFDPIEWINKTLDNNEENSESYASTVLYRLQVMINEVNSSLEETSKYCIKDLPRILNQAETLEESSNSLKSRIDELNGKMNKLTSQDSQTVQLISQLQKLHLQLQNIQSKNENQITPFIETNDKSETASIQSIEISSSEKP